MAITSEVVTITPEVAGEWLTTFNTGNRPLRQRAVKRLVAILERGEWSLNGDAIRFAEDGALLDGQHRLEAIHQSGIAAESLVVRGLANESQQTIDQGAKRNLSDQLRLMGYPNSVLLAATVNMKFKLDAGEVQGASARPTIAQALGTLRDHPSLVEATKMGSRWHGRLGQGSPAGVSALWYEFSSRDSDAAEAFFHGVIEGEGLVAGSPMFALRRLIETTHPGSVMLMALIIKAWNAYLAGTRVEKLMWRPVGQHAEDFPKIDDPIGA